MGNLRGARVLQCFVLTYLMLVEESSELLTITFASYMKEVV